MNRTMDRSRSLTALRQYHTYGISTLLATMLLLSTLSAGPASAQTKGGDGGDAVAGNNTNAGGTGGTSSAVSQGAPGDPGQSGNGGGSAGGGGGGAGITGGTGGGGGLFRTNIGGTGGAGGSHGTLVTSTTSNLGKIVGGNGGNGGDGSFGTNGLTGGGGGGAGGYGVVVNGASLNYTNFGIINGGNGGNGGDSGHATGTKGGDGGDGGFGVFLNGSATLINSGSGSITGGNGGNGGGTPANNGTGGGAGAGGAGVNGTVGINLVINDGTIAGGNGGTGGKGRIPGSDGAGGAGVFGSNLTVFNNAGGTIAGGNGGGSNGAGAAGVIGIGSDTIVNSATISGGLSGAGTTRADAIDFSGGGNTLELRAGFLINGNAVSTSGTVNGGDTLALGGPQNSTLDVQLIDKQYQGFSKLVKTGSSTWLLTTTGTVTYTIPVTIEDGTLVAGTTGSDPRTSHALGGGDVFLIGGTLRTPSLDPLTIIVGGNYTQGPGGTLALGVAGVDGSQYDHVQVGGNASLGGTLAVSSLNGFRPINGNAFLVLRTNVTRSGEFAQINDSLNNNPNLQRVDVYAPNGAALVYVATAAPSPTPPPSPSPSPSRSPSPTPTPTPSTPRPIIDIIPTPLPPVEANKPLLLSFLLEILNPTAEQLTSMFEIPFSGANTQRFNLTDRMAQIRQGSTGFVTALPTPAPRAGKEPVLEKDGKAPPPVFQPSPQNRWGVWLNGWGDWVSVEDDNFAKGYNFTTGGGSVGIDYRITDCLAVGLFGSYAHTWTSLNPGDVDVDTGLGGLYATYWRGGFYVNGGVYGGGNSDDTRRQALGRGNFASGDTSGYLFSTFVDTGYNFSFGNLSFGPVFAAQYTNVHVDGFTESAPLLPLNIHEDSEESWRTDLGAQAFYIWRVGKITVIPSLWMAWEHEFKESRLPLSFSAAAFPGVTATVFGPDIGHDSFLINAGAGVQWTPRISTYVGYRGQFGRTNYQSNSVTGTISFSF
jgi:outer membrane autotransporter protein